MPYYTDNFSGLAGQTARAEQVASETAAIQTGFELVEADIAKTLRASAAINAISANAAARALKYLRFDASGNPEVVSAPFNWRGDWATATAYIVGDIVAAGDYDSLYICTTAHTSGGTFDATKFGVLVDLTGLNVIRNEIKTASFTAVAGGDYMINSSTGDVVVTLPASPSILDAPINITHIAGSLAAGQSITIARNGKLIMGLAENLSIDKANASISLMWSNDTYGWRLRVLA